VLDSNFWLATHVITITIGYSGTFLAGALAIGYTLRRHFARRIDPVTTKALGATTYGIICFALFFSFIGTVLGGIWADQSWGRFWGWDPKENGALLIVLWNAIILHARWAGYVREKGIMAMAIFGNIITSLSWFGVNMLGVGLHSYGFMDSAFWALTGFIGSQLAFMALCLAPPKFWRVRSPESEKGPKPEQPALKT
jgi:ABC-type transport system involved in cytochrome c biogenesis permease subunit